jgi:hypothetical protein
MNKVNYLNKLSATIFGKKSSILFFAGFLLINLYYFTTNFFFYFFNKVSNADEYYDTILYSFSDLSLQKISYSPSQPYIFISSFVNLFLKSPKHSTRLVSLVFCIALIIYFFKKISRLQSSLLEKLYKITLFICAIFITNQMYIGTSDFLGYVLLVFPFLIILESIDSGKINLTSKKSLVLGILLGLSIATRPTAIILIALFYGSIFLILGFKALFCRENYIILFSGLCVFFLINFFPLVQQKNVILDVKEVPKETGVTWFQRNYLMAKFWDSNKIPKTQWVSTQDVIDYKKENPNFEFPKNNIDLLVKEPGLYVRQMLRMVSKAIYTSFRFMYLLFPLLLLCLLKSKRFKVINSISENNQKDIIKNRIIIVFYFLSIVAFSFIAIKMFEFRWIVPIMILYAYFAIAYLSKFPEKARFIIYTLSFMSGILLYSLFFIKIS